MKAKFVFTALAMLAVSLASPALTNWDAAGDSWWAHVQYLADDKLAGRDPGSPGFKLASEYVESKFKEAGLQPGGTSGFFQEVNFDVLQLDEASSQWKIKREGSETDIELDTDAILSAHVETDGPIDAEAVFVGYGFAVPERGFDEFKDLDLHGKIAVAIGGRPISIPGPISTYSQSFSVRWKALRKAGAIGFVSIANPKLSLPWERMTASRQRNTLVLADPGLNELRGLKFAATINPEHADKFLEGSGHTLAELMALADTGKPLPKFPLVGRYEAHIAINKLPQIKAPNVIGVLRGSDPKLSHEYVVLSAHLDHLGVGRPINGDNIYNGAMDNAAGIASLIEIAGQLESSPSKPKRSILFAAWTGEENGMLGSQYFVGHPTVKLHDVIAAINMDMYLPLFPLHYLEVQGLGESSLGNDIRAVAQLNDVEVQFDKQPPENRFIRSDQASFVQRGIPGLAFKFGWLPGSPEEKTFNDWIHTRYHSPSDDAQQPVDKAAAAQFTHIIGQLAVRVANAGSRPSWYPESFYAHLANSDKGLAAPSQ
jgi:Zn-dependent M28 family amino/carboxypeptidase